MSNLHSKQTGTQLHKPQKHTEAETESLLLKTKDNTVGYVGCYNTYSTVITPVADVSGSTNNKYFCLYSKHGSQKYAVWYNCSGAGTLTLPSGYDELIEIRIANGASVATIIDTTKLMLDGLTENYVLYDSLTDNTTSFTITQSNAPVVKDVTTGYLYATTTTAITEDKVLITEGSTKEVKFIPLEEKIQDVVGAMFTGNTETNITASYQDSDGTIDLVASGGISGITVKDEGSALTTAGTSLNFVGNGVVASGTGADKTITITDTVGVGGIRLNNGTTNGDSVDGNVTLTIAGGTGITSTVSGTTITISETVEKKSKSDVETLLGVTATTLGTFTGSTIADSRNIKTALQDIETDHEIVKGTSYHHTSFRWSAFNLNGTSNTDGTNPGWVFYEPNNNKDVMFSTPCDTSDMSYQTAMKGCIETPINNVRSVLVGGSCLSSGEPGDDYKITIWKANLHGGNGGSGLAMTLMGTFAIDGSNNIDPILDSISLASSSDCTLEDGDGVVVVMEDIEDYEDHDTRGTITLRFKDTF